MSSHCGKIRIPIIESADDKSQIAEYLEEYKGEGIQHIALGTSDIYASVETLKAGGVAFQEGVPDTYYEQVDGRLPGHGEDLPRLAANKILIAGAPTEGGGSLLQILTKNVIGPELGRAQSRERVGQCVRIWGGGVSLTTREP